MSLFQLKYPQSRFNALNPCALQMDLMSTTRQPIYNYYIYYISISSFDVLYPQMKGSKS